MAPHHCTPKKARVQGALEFARFQELHYGTPFYKNDIFRAMGVSKSMGYRILNDSERTFHNNPFADDTRGRKKKLSEEDLDKTEELIWNNGIEGRRLGNQALLMESGVEVECSDRTILRALGQRDWRRCVACQRSFVDEKLMKRRVEEAQTSLNVRPNPADWHDIRFSDEFHVTAGASGRVWILRKPGERYCPD
jgi:transposase